MARSGGQPVEFVGTRLRSPFLDADFRTAGHLVGLRWNGLRGANFDLGGIYVGPKNPLFEDKDHDGIAPTGSKADVGDSNPLYYHPRSVAPWLVPLGTGGLKSHFKEEDAADDPASFDDRSGRDARDHLDNYGNEVYYWSRSEPSFGSSFPRVIPYYKIDIARYLQNWKYAEPTLPPPFDSGGGLKNRHIFNLIWPLESWTEWLDSDNDGLPDNWESRWFSGSLSQLPGGDPDHDGMSNLDEYRMGQNPMAELRDKDVDKDGLDNVWELANGYNPWDGVNQANDDPDRDGWSNAEEQKNKTDPLAANSPPKLPDPNVVTGPPRGVSFDPNLPVYPEPPSTSGTNLDRWLPEPAKDKEELSPDRDADGDGVINSLDAVPYDDQLTFPRAPEAQYIAIPLTKADGVTAETGVPVAINNLGHILLVPPPPGDAASWTDLRGIAPGVEADPHARAPRLWKTVGQDSVEVPLPLMGKDTPYPDFTARWGHAGAENSRTVDLDLDRESDLVLAHALWGPNKSDQTLPDGTKNKVRIPNLAGRHAFIWDGAAKGAASRWLPWTPARGIESSDVPRFLLENKVDYADCTESVADRVLEGGYVTGAKLQLSQRHTPENGASQTSEERFSFFAWATVPQESALFMDLVEGRRSYNPGQGESRDWDLPFLKSPSRSLKAVHWNHHAIIRDLKGGQPGKEDPISVYSDQNAASRRKQEARARRQGEARPAGYSWYYLKDLWKPEGDLLKPEGQYLLPANTGGNSTPQEMNNFPMEEKPNGEDNKGQPFSRGPLIIGPPGRYWTRTASDEKEFVSGWLYHSPGIEERDSEDYQKYSAEDRIPFEIGPHAKINNQGVIICENRLWRNGVGHNIKDLVSSSGTGTEDTLSGFELIDINDSGVIAATAVQGNTRVPVMLVPVEVSTPSFTYHLAEDPNAVAETAAFLTTSNPVPVIKLTDPPTASPSGTSLSVSLPAGTIIDPLADWTSRTEMAPQSLTISTGSTERTLQLTDSRPSEKAGTWKPFAYEGRFAAQQFSLPLIEGTQTLSLRTSENAAGEIGQTSLLVTAFKQVSWGGTPGVTATVNFNLALTSLSDTTVDTLKFFRGERTAASGDPVLTETSADSLEFTGAYEGGTMTVRLDGSPTFTANADTLSATVELEAPDGWQWSSSMDFQETAGASKLFRCASEITGGGTGSVSYTWHCNASLADDQLAGNFTPYVVSMGKLGDNPAGFVLQVGPDGASADFELMEQDGKWVLKGAGTGEEGSWKWGALYLTEVRNSDGTLKERHVWLMDDRSVWRKIVLQPDDPLPLKIKPKNGGLAPVPIRLPVAEIGLKADHNPVAPFVTKLPDAASVQVGELNLQNVAWIAAHDGGGDDGPKMPLLEAKFDPAQFAPAGAAPPTKVRWRLQVAYQRPKNGGGFHPYAEEDFVLIPCPLKPGELKTLPPASEKATDVKAEFLQALNAGGDAKAAGLFTKTGSSDPRQKNYWTELPPDVAWKPNDEPSWSGEDGEIAQRGLFGGKATVFCQVLIGEKWLPEGEGLKFPFHIGGKNPSDAKCKAFIVQHSTVAMNFIRDIPDKGHNSEVTREFWFAYAIAKKETDGKFSDAVGWMRERPRWFPGSVPGLIYYNQFCEGKFDGDLQTLQDGTKPRFPLKVAGGPVAYPGIPVWGNDGRGLENGTGGYGLFQLTFGTQEGSKDRYLNPGDPEVYRPLEDGGAFAFTQYMPADRVFELTVSGGNVFSKNGPKLRRDANAGANRGIGLILNPMPRRWYWDWQENALGQLQIKLPIKYREMSYFLAAARIKAAARKKATIPGSNPEKLEAAPIPDHTVPRADETTREMSDANSNGSTDDQTPLPAAASGSLFPIKFAEEMDPDDHSKTKTKPKCADFIDLLMIKANNGGVSPYCTYKTTASPGNWLNGWIFNRVSTRFYVDGVIRGLDENHGKGG